jgi:hypothetical protein
MVLQRVRLSVLPPGTNVGWHVDYADTVDCGPMRMHIPVCTSPAFELEISGAGVVEPMRAAGALTSHPRIPPPRGVWRVWYC